MLLAGYVAGCLLSGPHENLGHMLRWHFLPRNRWFRVYVHKFVRDDCDRAFHDHPWDSWSLCLWGRMTELTPEGERQLGPGKLVYRPAEFQHRVMLNGGPAWTLFIVGRKRREWGFWCRRGFVHWTEFSRKGCGE